MDPDAVVWPGKMTGGASLTVNVRVADDAGLLAASDTFAVTV